MMATLDAEKIRFDAAPGDVIVMLSDGVSQTPEDAPWLLELLSGKWEDDLQDVAQRIVAVASRTREHKDDLSVALIRILAAEDAAERAPEAEPTPGVAPLTPVSVPVPEEGDEPPEVSNEDAQAAPEEDSPAPAPPLALPAPGDGAREAS